MKAVAEQLSERHRCESVLRARLARRDAARRRYAREREESRRADVSRFSRASESPRACALHHPRLRSPGDGTTGTRGRAPLRIDRAAAPHALHVPSHIFARLGLWEDDIRSNLASKAAAEVTTGRVSAAEKSSCARWSSSSTRTCRAAGSIEARGHRGGSARRFGKKTATTRTTTTPSSRAPHAARDRNA